jgi:predicted Zn-dependent protease
VKRSETFASLVASQPENELFRFSLAQALVAEHRLIDAIHHFKVCIEKKPDWMMARILLGKLLLELGKKPEAAIQLQAALKLAIDQSHEAPESEVRELLKSLQ